MIKGLLEKPVSATSLVVALLALTTWGVTRSPLQGEPASPLHPPSGCAFHPRCSIAVDTCSTDEPQLVTLGRRQVQCALAGTAAQARAATPAAATPAPGVVEVASGSR